MEKKSPKKKTQKLTKRELQGIEILKTLEKISRPSGIKDAVKWLHANR